MMIPEDWSLDPTNKESKKLNEMVSAHARRLHKALSAAGSKDDQYQAVYAFYRKYYTLTLCKSCVAAGINKSPTRDIILDFPWKELKQDRIFCLKIWEKINH
ncbi:MAG: hypothetical protein ACLGHN_00840 [Bacteriovoracia bacterium]